MTNQIVKNITQKDEVVAFEAARTLLNTSDIQAFEELCQKSDFLFDFVKDNVCKRIFNVANLSNYKNILKFFLIYDETYCDVFVKILCKFSDENLVNNLTELMQKGTNAQKAYCARFFEHRPNDKVINFLNENAFSDDEALSINSIKALAKVNNRAGVYTAYEMLKSADSFEILKAIRFLMAYPDLSRVDEVLDVAISSSMPENAVQEIANAVDLFGFIKENLLSSRLLMLNIIINGLGEILPLYNICYYRMFDIICFLINQSYEEENSQISALLWNMRLKFALLFENEEYTFDEDVDTKNEIKKIFGLLNSQGEDFWSEQLELLSKELEQDEKRIVSALNIIKEIGDFKNIASIIALTKSNNELIVCLAFETLKVLNKLDEVDTKRILSGIKNKNIYAIIENMSI